MHIIESNLIFKPLSYNLAPTIVVLHHAEAKNCTIEDIHKWHLNNGWAGCGYHYFVRKDGSIYRGRPENAVGSHCLGANERSIGICAEGSYMNETMPVAQKEAIIELARDICSRLGINEVYGHREMKSTNCPGDNYPLEEIKQAIFNKDNFDPIAYMQGYRDLLEAYAKDHPDFIEWAKWHYDNYGKTEIAEGRR